MAALAEIPDLALRISAALSAAGISHAVSGAVALGVHGIVRGTQDVDVAVVTPSTRWPEVFGLLREVGFAGRDEDLIRSLRERFVAEMTAGPVRVEVLVPVVPYHRALVERAVKVVVGGRSMPVVTAEDLVVLKTLWSRAKDRADVEALVAARGDMDRSYVRGTLASLLPVRDARTRWIEEVLARHPTSPPG